MDATKKRLTAPQLVLLIGLGIALVTVVSGIAIGVFSHTEDNPVTREVFGGIPWYLKLAFYTSSRC